MGSLHHRRIKERTILGGGEINDFRDRMGACRSPMRSYPVLPTQRLLRTWTRFLSSISFYTIVRGDNPPSDIGASLTPYPDIGLWTFPFFLCAEAILVDRTRSGFEDLKGRTAPDLAVYLRSQSLGASSEQHSRNSNLPCIPLLVSLQSSDLRRFPTSPWIPIHGSHDGRLSGRNLSPLRSSMHA